MSDPRYPIGPFDFQRAVTEADRRAAILEIAERPARLREAVSGLGPAQLDTPQREGAWTPRQIVHHIPDSHLNGYIRFKIGLAEDRGTVRAYDQSVWAELPEAKSGPIEASLDLLDALHRRWSLAIAALSPGDFARTFHHPDNGETTIERHLANYAWHGRHHTAQILALRERKGW
jgi:uncharacterized damage-inducible protein DinB